MVADADVPDFLTQPQIRETQMSPGVQEHVVRLDIPMDVPQRVHGADGAGRLRHIKPSQRLAEGILLHQQTHEIPPGHEIHHHVQRRLVLKRIVQRRQPSVAPVRHRQHVPLGLHVPHLVLLDHPSLLHAFECVDRQPGFGRRGPVLLTRVAPAAPHQPHLPEGATSDHRQRFEVAGGDLPPFLAVDDLLLALELVAQGLLLRFGQGHHGAFQLQLADLPVFLRVRRTRGRRLPD
mmetsp:Transcript_21612/g.49150  ORF Transcript_21612/g.49150 Transcript_21612/m.49150 type:complete len:235 (+) Transcript_21612:1255-1959(+)